MQTKKVAAILALSWAISSTPVLAETNNIALGKSVSLAGNYGGDQGSWGNFTLAETQSLTDGIFFPESTQWNNGSIFWNSLQNSIEIDLAGVFSINGFTVQADDNDTYRIEYKLGSGDWAAVWSIPAPGGWGLITSSTSVSPILADALRFSATGGDNFYSVSEIQAFGAPVPVPGALWLMGSGLLGLLGLRRGRK
jgi:hypothetical protein